MSYIKPMIISNTELAEGIFAGSGCYTVTPRPHQFTQNGRADYRFQFDCVHNANHSCDTQYLTVVFDQPITYVGSSGTLVENNNNIVIVEYHYHNNPNDNIGLGDLIVNAESCPNILSSTMSDIEN